MRASVSTHTRSAHGRTGGVTSFTRSLLLSVSTTAVTVTGVALDATATTGSVRALRFELSSTCTATGTPSNSYVTPTIAAVTSNAGLTAMTVPLPASGLNVAGLWSVCVDWTAAASTNFVRVGPAAMYIEVAAATSVTPTTTVLAGVNTATVNVAGVALDVTATTGSVRAVRFERASTCTSGSSSVNSVVTPTFGTVSNNGAFTQLSVPLSSTSGLSAGTWSVCIDYTAATASPTYVKVTGLVQVGELKEEGERGQGGGGERG